MLCKDMFSRRSLICVFLSCNLTVSEQYVLENIALKKNASDSNLGDEENARLAVDGGLSQQYFQGSCTHTTHARAFWEVDLGKVYFINHVKIFNRMDCCGYRLRNVELYMRPETKTYKKIGYHGGVVGSKYTFELGKTVFGRWVRITRSPDIKDTLTLCEVQVFGYANSQYIGIETTDLGNENQTPIQTLSAIQCAFICFKRNNCERTTFHRNQIRQNMCVYK